MAGKPNVTFIASDEAFEASLEYLNNTREDIPVAVDVEASSLDPITGTLILLQIGTKSWVNVYDVRVLKKEQVIHLLNWLNTRKCIGHNFKFDIKYLAQKYGVVLRDVHDTMLAEAILFMGVGDPFIKYSTLVKKYCYVELEKETRKQFEDSPKVIITPELLEYSAADVMFLPYIFEFQMEQMQEKRSMNSYKLEMRLLPAVSCMELDGVTLDKDAWVILVKKAKAKANELSEEIRTRIEDTARRRITQKKFKDGRDMLEYFKVKLRGEHKKVAYSREYLSTVTDTEEMVTVFYDNFNTSSPYQMQRIMNLMGIPVTSTDSKYLKRDFPEFEFAVLLVDYRAWFKLATSFGENFYRHINPVTGKIHSSFDQMATRTGRFASSGPNLQNIKRGTDYRHSFIASKDYMMATADYSQIELRLAAEASKDENMLSAFRERRDLHAETAIGSFELNVTEEELDSELRTDGKSLNFAIIYGTSAKGIAYNFQIPHKEGLAILDRHRNLYPSLHSFIDVSREQILARGYSVTPLGRRRYFTVPNKFDRYNIKEKFKIYKEGFNHIIQGGSADMLKIAMVTVWENNPFGKLLRAVMSIHDEIVYEIHKSILEEGEAFIRDEMIKAGQIFIKSIPVEVGINIAPHWEK
jgi:DNA polymerase I-like protein with 3'-5' exonuclease and polymerase domains